MNHEKTGKIAKYLLFIGLLFCALKYGLKNDMSNINIFIIIAISLLLFIIVENGETLFLKKEKSNNNCESVCAMREHMTSSNEFDYSKIRDDMDREIASQLNEPRENINAKQNIIDSEQEQEQVPIPQTLPRYNYDKISNDNDEQITSHTNEYNEKEYSIPFRRRSEQITSNGSRAKDDVLKSETKYNVVTYHTVPQIINSGSFEYGYSFLPPEKWYPTPPFPPVCVAEKQCSVCPVYTSGTNVDLKEWDSSRRITPPDEINVKYIEDKLNSGR
jgi:hypothetical protein